MKNCFDLTGMRAIVTGAAGGLSLGMAEGLHEFGAELVIIDVKDEGAQTACRLGETGAPVHFVKADLSSRADLEAAFEKAMAFLDGRVDILVNGAGIQRKIKTEDFPLEQWDLVLNINLNAVFILSQLAGRKMLEQGYGKIINIASMLSFFGGDSVPAYAATKGAVAQLTKAMCNEWASRGINVNAVAPGFMDTELNRHINMQNNPERHMKIAERIPAGRWGTPEDMKYLAVFLASHASDYINGAVIPCDGGYLVK